MKVNKILNKAIIVKGDIIEVTKDDPSGWWEGTINGKSGMFPAGFVTVIEYAS